MKEKNDRILNQIDFDGKDVFEIGTGYGGFTLAHFRRANSILGIDTDREAVEYLENNWPFSQENDRVEFREGDVVELSLKGKEFDVVVFSNSF
jgi:16S rRNA A1518/A1519 N6-dimethyltransferase RsmA/KsgA/DIM1 with predicted DNA glycosylase/AP lyase activity